MNRVVKHLSNLIRIPSPSSVSNRPVIDYAIQILHQAQWQTREIIYRDVAGIEKVNLIASPPGQNPHDTAVELVFMCPHRDSPLFNQLATGARAVCG